VTTSGVRHGCELIEENRQLSGEQNGASDRRHRTLVEIASTTRAYSTDTAEKLVRLFAQTCGLVFTNSRMQDYDDIVTQRFACTVCTSLGNVTPSPHRPIRSGTRGGAGRILALDERPGVIFRSLKGPIFVD